jgi:hypothetical protein
LGGWGVHVHALGCGVVAHKRGTIQSPAPPPKSLVETIDLVLLFQSLNATEFKTKQNGNGLVVVPLTYLT